MDMIGKIIKLLWLLIPMFGAVAMWYFYQDAFLSVAFYLRMNSIQNV